MTSEEFDNKVIDVATSFGNNSEISYFFLPSESALTEGNCNTSTSTILIKSGVSSSKISEIKNKFQGGVMDLAKRNGLGHQKNRNGL